MNRVHHAKMLQTTFDRQIHQDEIVLDAIKKLGGKFRMRVMEFRKHLSEPMRESHIKDALKRLTDAGYLRVNGEKHDSRGVSYELIN